MKKRYSVISVLFILLILVILSFSQKTLASTDYPEYSIFFDPLSLLNGIIGFDFEYFINGNFSSYSGFSILSTEVQGVQASAFVFDIGVKYFIYLYEGLTFCFDYAFGSVSVLNVKIPISGINLIIGYRFKVDSFFMEPVAGISFMRMTSIKYYIDYSQTQFLYGVLVGFYF